jgi:hypothetical protein
MERRIAQDFYLHTRQPSPMLFLDVEPNPTQRIIKAACI